MYVYGCIMFLICALKYGRMALAKYVLEIKIN